jgi:hypothetical protein
MFRLSVALLSLIITCKSIAAELKPKYDMYNDDSPCSKMRGLIVRHEKTNGEFVYWGEMTNPKKCSSYVRGETLLHVAAEKDSKMALWDLVMHHRMNVDVQDVEGNTPLHYAARERNVYAVAWLLKHGAKPLVKNMFENTPQQCATEWSKAFDLIEYNTTSYQSIIDMLEEAEKGSRTKAIVYLQASRQP